MAPKNVVIVGGGGAGSKIARGLSEKLDRTKYTITLVSAHPYYIHYVAGIRMLVNEEGSLEDQILIEYDKLFVNGNGTFKQDTVTAIQMEKGSLKGGKVVLGSGETLDYDVLVLSPGSKWDSFLDLPYDREKVREHIQEWRRKFRNAKSVVLAGGGAVGVELAGELREYYPSTSVTIVHGAPRLLNDAYPTKFRLDVERRVRAKKVNLILDDFIDSFPASATRKGVELEADLTIPTRGPRPNTSWIATSLGEDVLSKQGYIRIKPTLQLDAYPSIFAAGDVIDFPEQKQVAKTIGHAAVAVPNIQNFLVGKELKKQYKKGPELVVLTIGKRGGASYADILWGLMFGDWFTSMFKSKSLFVSMTRKTLGHPA